MSKKELKEGYKEELKKELSDELLSEVTGGMNPIAENVGKTVRTGGSVSDEEKIKSLIKHTRQSC